MDKFFSFLITFIMNSCIKTRLQDSLILAKRDEQIIYTTTLTSSHFETTSTTTSSHVTYRNMSRRPFTKQEIIMFGSIFCAVISLVALITLLIICLLRRKSTSCSILPQWRRRERQPMNTNNQPSRNRNNDDVSVNPLINIDLDYNIQERKPKPKSSCLLQKHKLKPLYLVIKHRDYLNKREEKRRISRLQGSDIPRETCQLENTILQSENIITPKQEDILQERINLSQRESSNYSQNDNNNRRNIRVKFNEVVEVIRIKYEVDNLDLNEMSTKSNYSIINEEKTDIIKGKDKKIETGISDDNFYDLATNERFSKTFETLNGGIYHGVNYNYI